MSTSQTLRNEGFRLSVVTKKNQPPVVWEAYTNDFLRGSSLKDYLATHALYAIDSTLPLYQLFPHGECLPRNIPVYHI
eukprot:scaffold38017_cov72-Cyclotella_meneghiniana.AAC.3